MPTLPFVTPRSLRIPAMTWNGLSSSCQTRTSFENLISSRARASSNAGVTHASSPLAGMTTPNVRSLLPQCTPVKYDHARPALEKHRVDAVLRHQATRLLDPRSSLVVGDRGGLG